MTVNPPTIPLTLRESLINLEALPQSLTVRVMKIYWSFHHPWDTCLMKACFQKWAFPFKWSGGGEKGQESCLIQWSETFPAPEIAGLGLELVKMKHLHFQRVSLQFFKIFLCLLTWVEMSVF